MMESFADIKFIKGRKHSRNFGSLLKNIKFSKK